MGDVFPELHVRKKHILDTTRAEEERFLETIEGGMARFDELAPVGGTAKGADDPRHDQRRGRVPPVRHLRLSDRSHRADGARARLHRRHRRF